jgi:hypothetical protein
MHYRRLGVEGGAAAPGFGDKPLCQADPVDKSVVVQEGCSALSTACRFAMFKVKTAVSQRQFMGCSYEKMSNTVMRR